MSTYNKDIIIIITKKVSCNFFIMVTIGEMVWGGGGGVEEKINVGGAEICLGRGLLFV